MGSSFVQKVGRLENMVGWYHSHPGYGCWLSGIDVGTQSTQQMYSEPFLAIVIDPHRTIAAGKVEIGAFRTYPEVCCPYFMLSYACMHQHRLFLLLDQPCMLMHTPADCGFGVTGLQAS